MSDIHEKVVYVKSQPQTRDHRCHWPGCPKQVPPAMWGCKDHWYRLPKSLRTKIWKAYEPGQEIDGRPSAEYLEVAKEVERWIYQHEQEQLEAAGQLTLFKDPK